MLPGGEGVQHLVITGGVGVAFLFIDRSFAQQIHRERKTVLAQFGKAFHGFLHVLPDDELPSHALNIGTDDKAHYPCSNAPAKSGGSRAPAQKGRHVVAAAREIFLYVPEQGLGSGKIGEHIDKTE